MLRVEGMTASYGAVHALADVSLKVDDQIVCLLGANGAGKTTTLNCISGIVVPAAGRIFFQDEEITGLAPEHIVKRGIVQVPEGREIFAELTVSENLKLGAYLRRKRLRWL